MTDRARLGYRARIAALWAGTVVVLAAALGLAYAYAERVVVINTSYLGEPLTQEQFDALDEEWRRAALLIQLSDPLLSAGLILLVLVLAVQAVAWLRRERARPAPTGPPSR